MILHEINYSTKVKIGFGNVKNPLVQKLLAVFQNTVGIHKCYFSLSRFFTLCFGCRPLIRTRIGRINSFQRILVWKNATCYVETTWSWHCVRHLRLHTIDQIDRGLVNLATAAAVDHQQWNWISVPQAIHLWQPW